jgi:hypothetical protein
MPSELPMEGASKCAPWNGLPAVVQPWFTRTPAKSIAPAALNTTLPGNTRSLVPPSTRGSLPVARRIMLPPLLAGTGTPGA